MPSYGAGSKRAGDKLPGGDIKRVRLGANVHGMISRAKAAMIVGDCTFRTGELLEKILLNLSTEDLAKSVRVCKDWRNFITKSSPNLQRNMFLLAGPSKAKAESWTFDPLTQSLRVHNPCDQAFMDKMGKEWQARNFLLFPAILNPLIFKPVPATTRAITEDHGLHYLNYGVPTLFKTRPDLAAFRNSYPRDTVPASGKGSMVYNTFLTQPPAKEVEVDLAYWVQHPTNVGPRPETRKQHFHVVNPDGVSVGDLFLGILDACGGVEFVEKACETAIRVAETAVWHTGLVFATEGEKSIVRSGVFDQTGKGDEGQDVEMGDDEEEDDQVN